LCLKMPAGECPAGIAQQASEGRPMNTELMKYVPIQALIVQYNVIKDKFERIFNDIDQINKDLDTLLGNAYAVDYHLRSVGNEGQMRALRAAFWKHVFEKLQLRNLMSEAKRNEFDKQMDKEDLPEFTEENILSTFKSLTENVQSPVRSS
jgi:site-specific DNA-adenine methylase